MSLKTRFDSLRKNKKKVLIPFLVAGDPSLKATERLVLAFEKAGADLIEIGVPFSDPMADGPVIQAASERALKGGTTLKKVLGLVRRIRVRSEVPLLLMGYYNPIHAYGLKRYAQEAKKSGLSATIVVDLPPEESGALDRELKRVGIDLIRLLTPTSDRRRIQKVVQRSGGFIYFVSVTGITGSSVKGEETIGKKVAEIRRSTKLPIVIGFGISTPTQAGRLARMADGVVIGSALVKAASHYGVASLQKRVEEFRRVV